MGATINLQELPRVHVDDGDADQGVHKVEFYWDVVSLVYFY